MTVSNHYRWEILYRKLKNDYSRVVYSPTGIDNVDWLVKATFKIEESTSPSQFLKAMCLYMDSEGVRSESVISDYMLVCVNRYATWEDAYNELYGPYKQEEPATVGEPTEVVCICTGTQMLSGIWDSACKYHGGE